MRIGLCVLPEHPWSVAAPLWRQADELGLDHVWTYDHLVWAGLPDVPWGSTMVTLAAAATVTSTIELGTFVASPNFRHPALLAADVRTLVDLSGGRLILGLGGGGDLDAGLLGADLTRAERTRRFAELVPLVRRLLTQDHVEHEGEFFTCRDVRNPEPPPAPPVVVAANGPKGLALAAREGEGWLTIGRPGASDPQQWWTGVAELARSFDAAERRAVEDGERAADAAARRYLSLDSAGPIALSDPAHLLKECTRAAELGFTDVVVHRPRPTEPYRGDPAVLDDLPLAEIRAL